MAVLQRLLVTVHVNLLLFWALVDLLMRDMWAGVTSQQDQDWSSSLAELIRRNDETILAWSTKVLAQFQEDLVQAQGKNNQSRITNFIHLILLRPDGGDYYLWPPILHSLPSPAQLHHVPADLLLHGPRLPVGQVLERPAPTVCDLPHSYSK